MDFDSDLKIIRSVGNGHYFFYCPGCECCHSIIVPRWTWNEDFEKPTVSPSILSRGQVVCHLFVKNGMLEYLPDCTHQFAGETIPMERF